MGQMNQRTTERRREPPGGKEKATMDENKIKQLAADLLDKIKHGDTPDGAICDLLYDGSDKADVEKAVAFLLQFLADHTYMPSFKFQIGLETKGA